MSPNATPSASAIWKSLALTTALAVALATSPINITSDLGLDESSAFAKSDKSKGKGGSKSKGKSGSKGGSSKGGSSKGKSGSSNRGGSSASAKSFGGGSDSDGTTQGGKPNRSDWSKQGAAQYKAELAAWKAERRKGKRVASVEGGAKVKNVPAGKPQSLVRQYVLEDGLKQGDVASLLKSWNSLNRNEQAFLNNIDNPNSLPGKQVAYMSDSFAASAAMKEFNLAAAEADINLENFDEEAAVALAAAAIEAETFLNEPALVTEDDYIAALGTLGEEVEAKSVLDDPEADPLLTQAANTVIAYEDYEAAVAGAEATIAANTAYNEYQAAETAAASSFYEASVSYSGDYDPETMGELRERVDAIIEMGDFNNVIAEYDAANAEEVVEEEVVAETETTPVE